MATNENTVSKKIVEYGYIFSYIRRRYIIYTFSESGDRVLNFMCGLYEIDVYYDVIFG